MDELVFWVKGEPVAQPRHKVGAGFAGGKPRAYLPANHPVHAWKWQVCLAAIQAKGRHAHYPLTGAVQLRLLFVLARPQRLVWKTREMPRVYSVSKPDTDNLTKAILDAIKGVLILDDAQVAVLEAEKLYASGEEEPHVEIAISGLDEPEEE